MENEEPSGSSRFSQLFKRNSATPVPGLSQPLQNDSHEDSSNSNDEGKSES